MYDWGKRAFQELEDCPESCSHNVLVRVRICTQADYSPCYRSLNGPTFAVQRCLPAPICGGRTWISRSCSSLNYFP